MLQLVYMAQYQYAGQGACSGTHVQKIFRLLECEVVLEAAVHTYRVLVWVASRGLTNH